MFLTNHVPRIIGVQQLEYQDSELQDCITTCFPKRNAVMTLMITSIYMFISICLCLSEVDLEGG